MENFNFHHFDNSEAHLPPGFRFHPTDEELITFYLIKKVLDSTFTCRAIAEVDLNKCEPWGLPGKAKMGEKEWYFFSLRDRKYPTGLRTNRATEAGYWKATGKDREIFSSRTSSLVGMKKTLVFYRGRAPKGEKSNWVMHEYRLEGKLSYHYLSRSSKDEWVISRVFVKSGASAVGGSSGGGGSKKTRIGAGSGSSSLFPDVGSPSSASISLPPLLDSSPYTGPSTTVDSCSYDTKPSREHVPCFSTASAAPSFNHHAFMNFTGAPPHSIINGDASMQFGRNDGMSGFPSLRSLQENLQLPFFFSGVAPMQSAAVATAEDNMGGVCSSASNNWLGGHQENQRVERRSLNLGPTELDCMWTY